MTARRRTQTPTAARDSDAELVARCLDGDEAAWHALVDRHSPLVVAVARRAGLNETDADDVHQTVWRAAVEGLGTIRDPHSFPRWIARTTHFQSMRLLRGYAVARRAAPHVARADIDDVLPVDIVEQLELRRRVQDALGRLGGRCESLLRALYSEGDDSSYAEIGRRLGMPIGSIGPTRARCLNKLEQLLEGGSP